MRKEKKDPASTITIHAMVDLDNQCAYALKVNFSPYVSLSLSLSLLSLLRLLQVRPLYTCIQVAITTATSSATGYFLLPSENYTGSTISTDPDEVMSLRLRMISPYN